VTATSYLNNLCVFLLFSIVTEDDQKVDQNVPIELILLINNLRTNYRFPLVLSPSCLKLNSFMYLTSNEFNQ